MVTRIRLRERVGIFTVVGILGYGVLGRVVAQAVQGLGFPVRGWVRTARQDDIPLWAGLDALSLSSNHEQARAIRAEIEALRASGGAVMVSLGGAAGVSLAQVYRQKGLGAAALAEAYGSAVEALGLRKLDFDIEGAAIAEPQTLRLQMQAVALMQQSHPDLEVWLTLPVLPQGLTNDGLNTVRIALEQGARIDGVNVMAMDYGDEYVAMGAHAISAARATAAQLTAIQCSLSRWNRRRPTWHSAVWTINPSPRPR